MRRISFIALAVLSACAPVPQAEVTKSYPQEATSGTMLPAMQGFTASASFNSVKSNSELARDFLNLEFRMESGRALPTFSRFQGAILVQLAGDVPASAPADLTRLIARLQSEAGLNIRMVQTGEAASVLIDFQPRRQMQNVVPMAACFVVPRVQSFAEYKTKRNGPAVDWTTVQTREQVAIFIPSDTSPQEVRDCLHEELAQSIGPLNDLYHLPDSVFNDDNFNTALTGFDMLMLRLHYAPELRNGMNEAEAARALPGLLARLNPDGEGGGGQSLQIAPRSWVAAVEGAFGPGVRPAARASAADRMVSIAMAQGWRDGRLAFSFYAKGRALTASQPDVAVQAFARAVEIYATIPGAAVQRAHIDMQLAAIALAAGQNDRAISLTDGAIPVVKRAENAALLATLMLIKAEALDNAGQSGAAQALRLDSLGWARYGFGSEPQVRARMSEIAALGARGARG